MAIDYTAFAYLLSAEVVSLVTANAYIGPICIGPFYNSRYKRWSIESVVAFLEHRDHVHHM